MNLKQELDDFFKTLSKSSNFNDIIWICDRYRKNISQLAKNFTIYFANVHLKFVYLLKYFLLLQLRNGLSIKTAKSYVTNINTFFMWINNTQKIYDLKKVSPKIVSEYKKFLESSEKTIDTKHEKWSAVYNFFERMIGWEGIPKGNPFYRKNPFPKPTQHKSKYIEAYVINQLDSIFKNEEIALVIRLVYWLLRSIPNRIQEVLDMKIKCLKPFAQNWVIFIPTTKQNGGYKEPQIRCVHIKEEGHGKYLMDLIREQQESANKLQEILKNDLLFTHRVRRPNPKNKNYYHLTKQTTVISQDSVRRFINNICKKYNVIDSKGNPYRITSHQLRHNGITDMLYFGFQPIEIQYITGHQTDAMILQSYNHPQEDEIIRGQKAVIDKGSDEEKPIVYFKGKIYNMDEKREQWLLRNIRAQKLKFGICGDIVNCRGKMFECLSCNNYIPDMKDLKYFEVQVESWKRKVIAFENIQCMKENAEYNLNLNQSIVDKIKKILYEQSELNELIVY